MATDACEEHPRELPLLLRTPALRPRLSVSTQQSEGAFGVGRAGMLYRDLLPDRAGGAVIASHIRIPSGGPVPDYVHFHRVAFQLIFCLDGWVDVVYEGQARVRPLGRDPSWQPAASARGRSMACTAAWPAALADICSGERTKQAVPNLGIAPAPRAEASLAMPSSVVRLPSNCPRCADT